MRQVWGGRWKDGSSCLVLLHDGNAHKLIDIYVGASSGMPTIYTRKNLGRTVGSNTFMDLLLSDSPNTRWETPISVAVADGLVIVACTSNELTSPGHPEPYSCSLCYWDDGTPDWEMVATMPDREIGKLRGKVWMLNGAFLPSHTTGAIQDCFFAMANYINRDPDGPDEPRGGMVMLARATRGSGTAAWSTTPVANSSGYLYEVTYPEYVSGSGMHAHSASILFPSTTTAVVMMAIGDDGINNRIVKLSRSSLTNWETDSPPAEPDPTSCTVPPPDPSSSSSWRAWEDRNGQRRRIQFTNATWTYQSQSGTYTVGTLQSGTAFARLGVDADIVGMPIIFRGTLPGTSPSGGYVNSMAIIQGHDAGDTNKLVLHWYTAPGTSQVVSGTVSGEIWADNSMQFVGQVPLADKRSLLAGADENLVGIYKVVLATNKETDRFIGVNAYGVPPEVLFIDGESSDQYRTPTWNGLRLLCARPGEGRQFMAYVNPGSVPGWDGTYDACQLMYSFEGDLWGDLFQYRDPQWTASSFFGYDRVCLSLGEDGGGSNKRLVMMDVPHSLAGRPLGISPGATNRLNPSLLSGTTVANDGAGAFGGNEIIGVSLPSGVPTPPALGPLLKCTMTGSGDLGRIVLSASAAMPAGRAGKFRLKFWIYVLAHSNPDDYSPQNTAPFAAVGGTMRLEFGVAGSFSTSFQGLPVDIGAIGGTGWVPVTVYSDTDDWIGSTVPGSTWQLAMWLKGPGGAFFRQQYLIAFESLVIDGSGEPECVAAPLPYSTGTDVGDTEFMEIKGFSCGTHWTATIAARVPDTGPDQISTLNGLPDDRVAFSLGNVTRDMSGNVTSVNGALRVVFDKPNLRLTVRDDDDSEIQVLPDVISLASGGVIFEQSIYYLKGKQVLVAIAKGNAYESGYSYYTVWASVGGTVVGMSTGILKDVAPNRFNSGDGAGDNPDSVEVFAVSIDDAVALSDSTVRSTLHTLSFITPLMYHDPETDEDVVLPTAELPPVREYP